MNTRKRIDVEHCLSWCLAAYAETKTTGHYVASAMKIPSSDQLSSCALKAGLAVKTNGSRVGRAWANMEKVPTEVEAEILFSEYQLERQKQYQKNYVDKGKVGKGKVGKGKVAKLPTTAKARADESLGPKVDRLCDQVDKLIEIMQELRDEWKN